MKVHELSAGDIFYICYTSSSTVLDGPYRVKAYHLMQLYSRSSSIVRATNLLDSTDYYFPGHIECVKMGSTPDADR